MISQKINVSSSLIYFNEYNFEEVALMQTLKQEAIEAISKLPDSASLEEIMYRLYVIDKVRKGLEATERGETISVGDMKKEIGVW